MTKDIPPVPKKESNPWTDLWKKEDWWAIWLGMVLLISVFSGLVDAVPKMPKWTWGEFGAILPGGLILPLMGLALVFAVLFALAIAIMKPGEGRRFPAAFAVVFLLAMAVYIFASEKVVKSWGIGYAFWALGIGLLVANTFGVPQWLKPAMRTEFYIKTGLVILGAEIVLGNILKFGFYGIAIAWVVTPIVIVFMWLFGTRILKMANKPLIIIIATATSVCGVSAAIAAAAASRAKKEDLTIAVGMTLIFTVLMMVAMPIGIKAIGMDEMIGGAWMGGTIDATGAVVLAGEVLGERAEAVAAIVKMIQNVLIGVVAFCIAAYWVARVELNSDAPRPGLNEIWKRFPKFILGFMAASILVSLVAVPAMGEDTVGGFLKLTKVFRGWLFCLAFISIGLETNFKAMVKQMAGGKPFTLYLAGQTFNLVLTLIVAWLVLSGRIFPAPPAL
jgi:uncharacterized membrane protein YadS